MQIFIDDVEVVAVAFRFQRLAPTLYLTDKIRSLLIRERLVTEQLSRLGVLYALHVLPRFVRCKATLHRRLSAYLVIQVLDRCGSCNRLSR